MVPKLREFRRPVRIILAPLILTLNHGVARTFHEFLPGSELFLMPGARHSSKWMRPEQVARFNPRHAKPREQAVLMLVTKSPTEPSVSGPAARAAD
jgi:hypothetical protein